ncbi:hypothetical protein [Streptomyces sp. 1222.5]|uniref:hypothetical protein n=1 Tax=Streptomyces sp. 1222.5 TaxID=1881026 RepID=UPI003EC0581D
MWQHVGRLLMEAAGGRHPDHLTPGVIVNQTDPTAPIRKGLLPTTPPPEWEFSSAFATGPDSEPGLLLVPGDAGPVVVRRLVAYSDWEPVRPDRWADEPQTDAAAVSAVVPPPPSRADVLRWAADQIDAETRQAKADGVLEPDKYRPCRDASAQLRRLAGEAHDTGTQQQGAAEAEPESCAHCGKTIRRITGTLAEWWVHVPGGQAFCYPWQPAKSPRATPKPAPAEQQPAAADDEETTTPCSSRPCNPAADELCDTHAAAHYHQLGEHAFCGPECGEQQ